MFCNWGPYSNGERVETEGIGLHFEHAGALIKYSAGSISIAVCTCSYKFTPAHKRILHMQVR